MKPHMGGINGCPVQDSRPMRVEPGLIAELLWERLVVKGSVGLESIRISVYSFLLFSVLPIRYSLLSSRITPLVKMLRLCPAV